MLATNENGSCPLVPGARVRICEPTLQAYYGVYGTVIRLHGCASRPMTYVDVQMDDVPLDEGHAVFYVHEVSPVAGNPGAPAST
ncbi:MAG: hypothetical protein OHK0022_10690 [Roseiflexaceae bacterium]